MKKYKQNRRLITVICDYCGKEFQKPISEYNRNLKLGRHNYCSRHCCGCAIINNNIPKDYINSDKNKEHIKSFCNNRKDEYTPFRYTYNCIKRRYKNVDLSLKYLKELWELQNGKCIYTHIPLVLTTYSKLKIIDVRYRASLDRIDSSKGYVIGNVQFVSTPINFMKNTMSDKDTKEFLKLIYDYTLPFDKDETISSPKI